jgi:hypothetical protein
MNITINKEELEWIQRKKWLNTEQCAIYTGFSVNTIRDKAQSKDIPFHRRKNSHILVLKGSRLISG